MEIAGLQSNEKVQKEATQVFEYLNENIQSRLFSVQSHRGNMLHNLNHMTESWDGYNNADDVILSICRMHSKICLITDDINLRLKARTINVPVLKPAQLSL